MRNYVYIPKYLDTWSTQPSLRRIVNRFHQSTGIDNHRLIAKTTVLRCAQLICFHKRVLLKYGGHKKLIQCYLRHLCISVDGEVRLCFIAINNHQLRLLEPVLLHDCCIAGRCIIICHFCRLNTAWTPWTKIHNRGTVAYGPLTRYVKLRVSHAPGMPGTFFPPPTSKETASKRSEHASRHVGHARAVMHIGIANPWWHSQRMRNPQFYVSGKRPTSWTKHKAHQQR